MKRLTKEDLQKLLIKAGLTENETRIMCYFFSLPLPPGMEQKELTMSDFWTRQTLAKALRKMGQAVHTAQTT